jgi:hypothetical protein
MPATVGLFAHEDKDQCDGENKRDYRQVDDHKSRAAFDLRKEVVSMHTQDL